MIKKLHHAAYRCRSSEETRQFYEDFLGLKLVGSLEISTTATGRAANVLHTFYAMEDGACIAFFEEPDTPFDFHDQRDFDLHIALEVSEEELQSRFAAAKAAGIEVRGVSDHKMCHSIYFRDPNGYVLELAASTRDYDRLMDPAQNRAREILDAWTLQRA